MAHRRRGGTNIEEVGDVSGDNSVGAGPPCHSVRHKNDNNNESSDISSMLSVQSKANYSNQCATPSQLGNTGSNQNGQAFLQYDSTADDLEGEGATFKFSPSLTAPCDQKVQQSSAASSS